MAHSHEINSTESFALCSLWPTVTVSYGFPYIVLVNSITMVISVLGNLVTSVTILRSPKLINEVSYILVCSVSIADFLLGVLGQPLFLAMLITRFSSRALCAATYIVSYVCAGASVLGIVSITLERFVYIMHPFKHDVWISKRIVCLMISAAWIPSCLFAAVPFISYHKLFLHLANLVILVLISGMSGFANITFSALAMKKLAQAPMPATRRRHRRNKQQKQLVLMVVYLAFAFAIFWLPYGIVGMLFAVTPMDPSSPLMALFQWSVTLGFANSAFNVLIYARKNRTLRLEIKRFLRKNLSKDIGTSTASSENNSSS